jgi:uroporphyrinogen-III synthase
MTLRVAVTRALPEAERTAETLRARGADAIVAPLLQVRALAFDTDLAGVQALLFTSANGARAFAQAAHARNLPVLAVGEATARAARKAGFINVAAGDSDANALAALARARLAPQAGKLVHISGAHVAGDLVGAVAAVGFTAERRVAYQAAIVETLPGAFSTPLDVVLFHSARAAAAFLGFAAPGAGRLTAACLSPVVADTASAAPWKKLIAAPEPTEAALIAAALSSTDANA